MPGIPIPIPTRSAMESRTQIFQKLKPPCVALGEAARTLNGVNANIQNVTIRLEEVKQTLTAVTKLSHSLDDQLAGYVFFPLALVLKASQKVSIRCLELALQCLALLIAHGWRSRVQPETAVQIVILCTLMASKTPTGLASTSSTDELQSSALWCLHHLFDALDSTSGATVALTSDSNRPQLGMTISNILDAIYEGQSFDVQDAGAQALMALLKNVATREIQASFVPGVVSKLTQVLTPQTKQRRNHAILIRSLDILRLLFAKTLSSDASKAATCQDATAGKANTSTVITKNWLETAATQLKPAVNKILRLQDHERIDVKEALAQFCFVFLKECRVTLPSCVPVALEALLHLSSEETGDSIKFRIEALFAAETALANQVLNTLYDWLQSLTTKMQSADEQAKAQRMRQISTAYSIVAATGADTSTIDRLLADVLRDSVVVNLMTSSIKKQSDREISSMNTLALTNLDHGTHNMDFASPLVKFQVQRPVLDAIEGFAELITSSSTSKAYSAELARSLRQSQGDAQIASFWLLLTATETALGRQSEIDPFLSFDAESPISWTEHLEDLYSLSLGILTDSSEDLVDERLQALALRALALRARTSGEEFRYELIDALYPALHTLATPNEQLQQDSITTLNIFTASCAYSSVRDLIVENVDYLTNAVALKLNSFDVSPQAPQVLLMMVKLAGPSLLPYLEDTIDSIFAALEDYHGYPVLVELLFRVLSAVAEEGVKAPQLASPQNGQRALMAMKTEPVQAITVANLVEYLRERAVEEKEALSAEGQLEEHPKRPWKDADSTKDEQHEEGSDHEDDQVEDIEVPPPAPKQFGLLLKISELTQHFLPSASASLRTSLLGLIRTTTPALAKHENSFLPLINTLWPEVVSRLDDAEPYVVSSALEIVALLCEHARDFMRSRVLQLWPAIVEMHQKIAKEMIHTTRSRDQSSADVREKGSKALVPSTASLKQALTRMQRTPADYSDTSIRTIWTSLVHSITAIVKHVEIPPEQFDEALSMLKPVIEDEDIRTAFERQNGDAVWLIRMRNGAFHPPIPPRLELHACQFAAVPG